MELTQNLEFLAVNLTTLTRFYFTPFSKHIQDFATASTYLAPFAGRFAPFGCPMYPTCLNIKLVNFVFVNESVMKMEKIEHINYIKAPLLMFTKH